jgi:hypothetical protein
MITPEERESIILEAVERALLVLPETIGSLLTSHMALAKINSQFYKDHPEFKDKKDIVASIIEKIDGENPTLDYKDILGKAVPEIHRRIETVDSLNMKSVSSNPSRTYEPLTVPKIDNRHGEL